MFEYCKELLKQCKKKFPETFKSYNESDIQKFLSIYGLIYKVYILYPSLYNLNQKVVYKAKNSKPVNNNMKKSIKNNGKEKFYVKKISTNSNASDLYSKKYRINDVNEKSSSNSNVPQLNNENPCDKVKMQVDQYRRNQIALNYYNSRNKQDFSNNGPINHSIAQHHQPYKNYNFFEKKPNSQEKQNIISNEISSEKKTSEISYNCFRLDISRSFTSTGVLRYHCRFREISSQNEEFLREMKPYVCHIKNCNKIFVCKHAIRKHYYLKHGLDISFKEIEEFHDKRYHFI